MMFSLASGSGQKLRIVLLGSIGSGKTSVGNTILGKEEFNRWITTQCVKREGEVAGRHVTVVDTPGWWSDVPVKFTSERNREEIKHSGSLCPPGPHAFLLVLPIKAVYTDTKIAGLEEHVNLLGEGVWKHTLVLFTYGDSLGERTIEQYVESEGEALQWLIDKCGNRFHAFNNTNRADGSQVTELMEKIEMIVAGNSGLHYEIGDKRDGVNTFWKSRPKSVSQASLDSGYGSHRSINLSTELETKYYTQRNFTGSEHRSVVSPCPVMMYAPQGLKSASTFASYGHRHNLF